MDYKLISENWKKFLNEFQAQPDPGVGGGGAGPLTWGEIQRKCEEVWTAKRIQACYFKSVGGLPSVAQIIKMVSKDKDILATLDAVESGDVDIKFDYTTPKKRKDRLGQEFRPAGEASRDEDADTSTGRVIIIYLDPEIISGYGVRLGRLFYELKITIQQWNERYYRNIEDSSNYFIKRYGSEASDYFAQGAISRDRLDNFVNLWGFTLLLSHASLFVHEMAHVFDPENIYNLYRNQEEFNRFFKAHTEEDPDREKYDEWPYNSRAFRFARYIANYLKSDDQKQIERKKAEKAKEAWLKLRSSMSGRTEMFATNRTKDFIADLEDSELLKLAYSTESGGPTNVAASGVNLEKFSFMTSLTPPPTKDNVTQDSGPNRTSGLVSGMRRKYFNLIYGVRDGELYPRIIDYLSYSENKYSEKCSKRLHMMSKDIQLDIYGVAGGESDDRLAPDSYEDRKYITRTRRSSEKEMGLQESKKTIKIKII